MNPKRVNWLFAFITALNILVPVLLSAVAADVEFGTISLLLISQALLLLPAILILAITRTNPLELIACARPKWSVSLLVVLITCLCMPLIITVNMFSQLFVENEVVNLQPMLQGVPAWQLLLVIGILGPLNEEFVFRGVIYHGYRRSGRFMVSMLISAILFGLMHLNFNQMSYAVVVGVIGVLLVEGTGNIFYSMLFHAVINTINVIQMLFQRTEAASLDAYETKQMVETVMNMPYEQAVCMMTSVYMVIACITLPMAGCLYYLILKKEGRSEHVRVLFSKEGQIGVKDRNRRIISVVLVISVFTCLAYMVVSSIWIKW